MLELKNLSKKFHQKVVLDDLSLSVGKGQIATLLGSSGVGKSTLLRVLNNLETLDAGQILLDGKQLDLNQVNKIHKIGMVFQQFNLFEHLTVIQNITLALEQVEGQSKAEAQKVAMNLLQKYGLQDKAHVQISQLSGGQKQRLAIARTLALKPTIICFDEPTSALDPLLTSYVAESIKELAQQGYTILVATHDTSLLEKLVGTVYLMDSGKIVESADITKFLAQRSDYPKLLDFVAGNRSD